MPKDPRVLFRVLLDDLRITFQDMQAQIEAHAETIKALRAALAYHAPNHPLL